MTKRFVPVTLNFIAPIGTLASILCILLAGCHSPTEFHDTSSPYPSPPRYFSIVSISDESLRLEWNANNDESYIIERAGSTNQFSAIGTTKLSVSFFLDSTVNLLNTYSYRVRAVRDTFVGQYSNAVKVVYGKAFPLLRQINLSSGLVRMVITRDGNYLATSSELDTSISIWNTFDWSIVKISGGGKGTWAMTFTNDSKNILVGGHPNIRVHRLSDGILLRTIQMDSAHTADIALSSDGATFVAADLQSNLLLFNFSDGTLIQKIATASSGPWSVATSPTSNLLVACTYHVLLVWDIDSRSQINRVEESYSNPMFSNNGELLSLFLLAYPEVSRVFRVSDWTPLYSYGVLVSANAFSPDNSIQLIGDRNVITLLNVPDGTSRQSFAAHTDRISSLVFFADGTTFVSGCLDGTIRVWSTLQVDQWHELRE